MRCMMTGPRKDILDWDEYFMALAVLASMRSRDPSTQVGAVIINHKHIVLATGFNGFPRNIDPKTFSWAREGDFLDTKYAYICHAESNAIDNRGTNSLEDSTIYTTLYPCHECSKRVIQNGIKEVVYLSNKYGHLPEYIAAAKMFEAAGVNTRELDIDKTIILEIKK